jgi:ADP-ribosylglycohydrolase
MRANPDRIHAKRLGALYGLCIGDALAMPVHWYYDRRALVTDYGWVEDYLAPKNPHPDSILWRSSYTALNSKGDILHDQARYWGRREVHYHQFLKAGENTLNIKLCQVLIQTLKEKGGYDPDDFLERYVAFMTTPASHNDTYIEECHRNFFRNYASGLPVEQCGEDEKHIGGLVSMIPLVALYSDRPEEACRAALKQMALTHPGTKMETAGSLVIDILLHVINGQSLEETIHKQLETQRNPLMRHPFKKWLHEPDDRVIGPRLSTACYVEDAVPSVIHLALKYHDDMEKALIINTNLGGDNAGRGAILGALMGAEHGMEKIPQRWKAGLLEPPDDWLIAV